MWWRPLQSLAGKRSFLREDLSPGRNGPAGPEDRRPEEAEGCGRGRVGWVRVGGGEDCNSVILGGFVLR